MPENPWRRVYVHHPMQVDIARPKPEAACVNMKKIMIVWMIFCKKLLSSFSMSQIYFFDLGLDHLDATHFIDCS